MADFGDVAGDQLLDRTLFFSATTFGNGANAPSVVNIGTTPAVAAAQFNNTNQTGVSSVYMPVNWDRTVDANFQFLFSLASPETDADALDWTVNYVCAQAGVTGAGFDSTSTSLTETLTVSTGFGLAIGDVYFLTMTISFDDSDNPFADAESIGFEFGPTDLASGIASINLVDARINYKALY